MLFFRQNEQNPAPAGQPDPYMIEEGGRYYVFATHPKGVQLYVSDDFENWRFDGFCFSLEGMKEYWAPAVTKIDGKYYMYVSAMPTGERDVHQQRIMAAVADRPEGPYTYVRDMLEPFSIDPHVIEYKGEYYMFYSINDYDHPHRAGTYIVVDKLTTPTEVEGKPVPVVKPSIDEEIYQRDRFKPGQHWHTIEGAFYFYDNDTHFCMYSGSAWTNDTYFVGYSTAHGSPDDLRELEWTKYPDNDTYRPVLAKNDFVEGTGHNSVIKRDGKWWIIYHGRDIVPEGEKKPGRTFRGDVMELDGDKITVTITK